MSRPRHKDWINREDFNDTNSHTLDYPQTVNSTDYYLGSSPIWNLHIHIHCTGNDDVRFVCQTIPLKLARGVARRYYVGGSLPLVLLHRLCRRDIAGVLCQLNHYNHDSQHWFLCCYWSYPHHSRAKQKYQTTYPRLEIQAEKKEVSSYTSSN